MEIIALSSLEKVFSSERPNDRWFNGFSMFKNERSSWQAAFCPEKNAEISFALNGELSAFSSIYLVEEVPVNLPCFDDADDYYLKKEPGLYPDVLRPLSGSFKAEGGKWYSLWVEVAPNGNSVGESELALELFADGMPCGEASVKIEVIDELLPEQELIHTCWYHSDCLCNYYNVEPFTDEFWRINENFVRTAVEHGINCILTPLFTPPLDTKVGGERKTVQLVKVKMSGKHYRFDFSDLKKWIEMCDKCGVKYFEMSHFFTQWGAKHAPKIVAYDKKGRLKKIFGWRTRTSSKKYDDFLRQFASALIEFMTANGINDRVFFHVSDEPGKKVLKIYKKRAALIEEIFPGYPVIDALSDFDFYSTGAVKIPIPCENEIEDFVGKVPELWTYYCCGQGKENVPNRFMSMPSSRNRALGVLMYKYDIKGFLQWGYNFYNTQYSIKPIDPFKVTDAGGKFPSGDSFVVYPDKNGEAIASLRLKVFYDALQDMRAFKLLEEKTDKGTVLELIEHRLDDPLTFKEYPQSADWLLTIRETANRWIEYSNKNKN